MKVVEVLKGNGDIEEIELLEEGGNINGKRVVINGLTAAQGKQYVLFLQHANGGGFSDNTYVILGSFMGKHEVLPSGRLKYLGPRDEVKKLQDELAKTNLSDVQQLKRR